MSAFFVFPEPFAVSATTGAVATAPAANLNFDEPGLVHRTSLTGSVTVQLTGTGTIDTIALVGTNLRATDLVRVRVAATLADTTTASAQANVQVAAWSGGKVSEKTAITIVHLAAPVTGRFVRIDFTATGHPDGFVQVQRLVAGIAAEHITVSNDFEVGISDGADAIAIRGRRSFVQGYKVWTVKAAFPHLTEIQYRNDFLPLVTRAGSGRAVLFVENFSGTPASPVFGQNDTFYGYLDKSGFKYDAYDNWRCEFQMTSTSI